jgi:hypothetical protein
MYEEYQEQPLADEYFVDMSPRPFGEVPGLWLKVIEMTEEFFGQEAPRASGSSTFVSVLILVVVSTICAVISSLISSVFGISTIPFGGAQDMPAMGMGDMAAVMGGMTLYIACCGFFGGIIGFYLGTGVNYLCARIFGGDGNFTTQAYLQSLVGVPVGVVTSVLSVFSAIPYLGCIFGLASFAVGIYGFILNVRAIKVAHHMTTGRAVAALLAPAVFLVIIPCVVIVLLALTGPAIGEIFEEIVLSI